MHSEGAATHTRRPAHATLDAPAGRIETHWTRVLYQDLLHGESAPARRERGEARGLVPRLALAGIALALYVAVYLAVGGILHALATPDATALIVPAGAQPLHATAAASDATR